jgi:putative membrane protein
MDEMKKMSGSAFDKHYMKMMVDDHKKTIDKFQSQSSNGTDEQLRSWASKTLPVLQMHHDSAQAVNKIKL